MMLAFFFFKGGKEDSLSTTRRRRVIIIIKSIFFLLFAQVDIDQRQVTREEGIEFAKAHGCLFLECSAKTKLNVEQVNQIFDNF